MPPLLRSHDPRPRYADLVRAFRKREAGKDAPGLSARVAEESRTEALAEAKELPRVPDRDFCRGGAGLVIATRGVGRAASSLGPVGHTQRECDRTIRGLPPAIQAGAGVENSCRNLGRPAV